MIALLVGLAGGAGAVARFLLDDAVVRRGWTRRWPAGTVAINLAGSFLLGLLAGWVGSAVLAPEWRTVVGVGFCGGFTTFSTACVEVVRMARDGRRPSATLLALGQLAAAVALAALGLALA